MFFPQHVSRVALTSRRAYQTSAYLQIAFDC